jgi:hypothetical protein
MRRVTWIAALVSIGVTATTLLSCSTAQAWPTSVSDAQQNRQAWAAGVPESVDLVKLWRAGSRSLAYELPAGVTLDQALGRVRERRAAVVALAGAELLAQTAERLELVRQIGGNINAYDRYAYASIPREYVDVSLAQTDALRVQVCIRQRTQQPGSAMNSTAAALMREKAGPRERVITCRLTFEDYLALYLLTGAP